MQGRSLVPLLLGQTPTDWRKGLYYHYYEFPAPHHVRPHYGIITDRYKLVHYYAPDLDEWELLDRTVDPEETKNFYEDKQYLSVRLDLRNNSSNSANKSVTPNHHRPGPTVVTARPSRQRGLLQLHRTNPIRRLGLLNQTTTWPRRT